MGLQLQEEGIILGQYQRLPCLEHNYFLFLNFCFTREHLPSLLSLPDSRHADDQKKPRIFSHYITNSSSESSGRSVAPFNHAHVQLCPSPSLYSSYNALACGKSPQSSVPEPQQTLPSTKAAVSAFTADTSWLWRLTQLFYLCE